MIMTAIFNYIQMFLKELRSWDNLPLSLVVFQPILVHIMLYIYNTLEEMKYETP